VTLLLLFLNSCEEAPKVYATKTEQLADSTFDNHSYANLDEIYTQHLHLDLEVNFSNKTIYGVARHTMHNNGTDTAIFDIKGLRIKKITLGESGNERETDFVIGNMDKDSILGQPLLVTVSPATTKINIYYETTEESKALDWLDATLTSSKKHPFLYTQGQAILARTWIPLQDSPSNRITYSAKVKVPEGLMALMSAQNPKEISEDGQYYFQMRQAIPSYLIALAVGNISYHAYNHRCGVYAEPELLPSASWELNDLPKMMRAAEKIYGNYKWGRYDVLLLPYSFPFGGMENPKLTFLNPTVIAGDKSLISVVAHELAHSWSGNLVTNKTWNDFWLNEGFTVYFEHRIMEELYGKEVADILSIIEFQELEQEIKEMYTDERRQDTKLQLSLRGRDPDDGMNQIAYVKGAYLLKTLELHFGRQVFDSFLNKYFKYFAFQSITTQDFERYIKSELFVPTKSDFPLEEWIHQEGLPKKIVEVKSERLERMETMAKDFSSGLDVLKPRKIIVKVGKKRRIRIDKIERQDHLTQEWQTFIRALPKDIGKDKMRQIDQYLGFFNSGNAEIMSEWFVLALQNDYDEIKPAIEKFLKKVGRRKFLLPIYKTAIHLPQHNAWILSIFENNSQNYHPISRGRIERLIK
jgi:leukotriene-A4 hydrolase